MATVTRIARAAKGGTSRIELELDGESWASMHEGLIAEFRLYSGREVDDATLEQLRERIAHTDGLARCHALISRRALTERQLGDKLVAEGFEPELAGRLVARSKELGLVDDEHYARSFAAGRTRRGHGPRRISQDLTQRGVDRRIVEAALAEVAAARDAEPDAEPPGLAALRRRFARVDLADVKERSRAQRFLLTRGFEYGQADAAIRALRDERAEG